MKELRSFFESEVKLVKPPNGASIGSLGTIPTQLVQAIEQLDGTVDNYWWVPSAEFNLHLVGSVDTPETILKIDAVCRTLGYESRTQLAFHGVPTLRMFEEALPIAQRVQSPTTTGART